MQLRLAFRQEGDWWNVYMAQPDTMEGARLIGTILMGAVINNPERKQTFMALMQEVFADAVKSVTGERPTEFEEQAAPEHERAGHG